LAEKRKPELADARALIDRVTHAQRWTGTDPKALVLLRDLTDAFPEGGRVWATNLIVQADGRATLTGRAAGTDAPLALLKRLRESGKFTDVQYGGDQPADRRSGSEITFNINFRFPALTQ
jgi:Tfp pilus assembly protein PilN